MTESELAPAAVVWWKTSLALVEIGYLGQAGRARLAGKHLATSDDDCKGGSA